MVSTKIGVVHRVGVVYVEWAWFVYSELSIGEREGEGIMATSNSTSLQRLAGELKSLHQEPVEGFVVTLPSEEDLYTWHVAIFGPPDTPYQGGYFKVSVSILLSLFFFFRLR